MVDPPRWWPDWGPVHRGEALLVLTVCAWVGWRLATSPNTWVPLLDDANLAFHEAGHLFFGLLGSTMGLYGGTLGQLVFPFVTAVTFARQGRVAGTALCVFWWFENLINIARYMADARAQRLPLAGGGEHDWLHIFGGWGVLQHDTRLAAAVAFVGWAGMVGSGAWLCWRAWQDRDAGWWEPGSM